MTRGHRARWWALATSVVVFLVACDASPGQEPDPDLTSEGVPYAGFSDEFPELPLAHGGRVEVPFGIAVTFPDDWTVRWEPSIFEPEIDSDLMYNLMLAEPITRTGEGCGVTVSRSSVSSLDQLVDDKISARSEHQLGAPAGGQAEVLLPAGRSIAIRDVVRDEDGQTIVVNPYFLRRGTTDYMLSCFGSDPPDDRWLSIAETFEFLPADE